MSNSIIAIVISSIALALSIYQFYYFHLKRPNIKMYTGPKILVTGHPNKLSFVVPVTLFNQGARLGKVVLITLTIKIKDNFYLIKWDNFSRLNSESTTWIQKNIAHTLVVPSYSTVTELVDFSWTLDPTINIGIDNNTVEIIFNFWSDISDKPKSVFSKLSLNPRERTQFDIIVGKTKDTNSGVKNVLYLELDSTLKSNQVLTDHEFKKLIS